MLQFSDWMVWEQVFIVVDLIQTVTKGVRSITDMYRDIDLDPAVQLEAHSSVGLHCEEGSVQVPAQYSGRNVSH